MKQTSRAVALLLLSEAQAATISQGGAYNDIMYVSQFGLTSGGDDNIIANRVTSRTAPYNWCPSWVQGATPCNASVTNGFAAATYQTGLITSGCAVQGGVTGACAPNLTTTLGSTCVHCLQKGGVWCSGTFSHDLPTGALYQCTTTVIATRVVNQAPASLKDRGACCNSIALFNGFVILKTGAVNTAPATTKNATGEPAKMNGWACPAFKTAQTATSDFTFAVPAFSDVNTSAYSWWCSNGLYNYVTGAGSASTTNSVQLILDIQNQRQELALVGCPQLRTRCGYIAATGTTTAAAVTNLDATLNATNNVDWYVQTITSTDKCTWVAYGATKPPVFSVNKATISSVSKGLDAASSWTIHHMEYNGSQLTIQASSVLQAFASDLDATSMVPQFTMGSDKYAKQRTWYGAGASIYAAENWQSPYQNGATDTSAFKSMQTYGYVAGFSGSADGTDYSSGTATYDNRQIRYFPLQLAINSNAMGTGVATAYNSASSSYTSAKTLWNNYVAILTKNSKVDAFAAAFSPPKAPTVPPLPNLPWMPAVTQTMYKASAGTTATAIQTTPSSTITAAAQPTTAQFWINGEGAALASGGGWGSFTASVIKFRDGWGKSYGTIGYQKLTDTGAKTMAAVYNQSWQCAAASPAATATSACPIKYASPTSAAAGTASNFTTNAVKFYTAISLWTAGYVSSPAYTFGGSTNQSYFYLKWEAGAGWNDTINKLAAPAAMTAATAASTLTGIVGAQALAASAVAAFGAAAALY